MASPYNGLLFNYEGSLVAAALWDMAIDAAEVGNKCIDVL